MTINPNKYPPKPYMLRVNQFGLDSEEDEFAKVTIVDLKGLQEIPQNTDEEWVKKFIRELGEPYSTNFKEFYIEENREEHMLILHVVTTDESYELEIIYESESNINWVRDQMTMEKYR